MKTTQIFKHLAPKAFKAENNRVVNGGDSRTNETVMNLSKKQ